MRGNESLLFDDPIPSRVESLPDLSAAGQGARLQATESEDEQEEAEQEEDEEELEREYTKRKQRHKKKQQGKIRPRRGR
jgi:hypothetical protein